MKNIFCLACLVSTSILLHACQMSAPIVSDKQNDKSVQPLVTDNTKSTRICTMQYDPVCGKTIENGKIAYRTFSNSCVAGNSENLINITKGACSDINTK